MDKFKIKELRIIFNSIVLGDAFSMFLNLHEPEVSAGNTSLTVFPLTI